MKLTGPAIRQALGAGTLTIDPLVRENIGPNSVDLRVAPELLEYERERLGYHPQLGTPIFAPLDLKKVTPTKVITIPEEGLVVRPGNFYLGSTFERIASAVFLTSVDGRSSVGRCSICVHCTAGRGEVGFNGNYTLEISSILPVRIYPMVRICQLYVERVEGQLEQYKGRYQHSKGAVASKFHEPTPPPDEI